VCDTESVANKRLTNQEGLWGFGEVISVPEGGALSASPLKFLNIIRCIHISSMLATCLAHLNLAVFHPIISDEEEQQILLEFNFFHFSLFLGPDIVGSRKVCRLVSPSMETNFST
jgi:hypothetical protein